MKYGCIGEKLPHSFSKEIHEKIGGYDYELCEIARQDLDAFLRKADFLAINVTIPYKEAVIPYLAYLSDTARAVGAVNTVVNRDGKLYGYNTDFSGLSALLDRTGVDLAGKKVLICGTGGTSKTAAAVAKHRNARMILAVSRTAKNGAITYEEARENHTDADVLLNTTPVGMFPHPDGLPLDPAAFPKLSGVIDAVYNPLRTNFVLAAEARGVKAAGGLYMLVAQAVAASGIFMDTPCPPGTADSVFQAILREKETLTLIGMPSSGKSTVGKLLAETLHRPFYDTDDEIVREIGMPIAAYFEKYGETAFRDVESAVVERLSNICGAVIATGGGAVLRDENVTALRRNGRLFFLDRPLEMLLPTPDRPLANDADKIERLYAERLPRYKTASDATVPVRFDPQEAVDAIIRSLS